jgi:hypothetical protein
MHKSQLFLPDFQLNWNLSASVNEIPSREFRQKRQERFEWCHAYSREASRRIDITKLLVLLAAALETCFKGIHILETECSYEKK